MKKQFILIMMLILALALTGCGSSAPETGTVVPATQPAAEETEIPENPLSLGRIEGGTYTNTYAGFGCDLDESWTFSSEEELQGLPEAARDRLEGTELGEALKDATSFMEMNANNCDLPANICVNYNKMFDALDLANRLAAQAMSEEELIDGTLLESDAMIEAYIQAGLTNVTIEKVKVNFLGEERWAMKTTCEVEGEPLHALQVYNHKAGHYLVTLTVKSWGEDNTQALLDLFYPVN